MGETETVPREMSKRYEKRRGPGVPRGLRVVNPDAAGIDLGAKSHYASVPDDRCAEPVRQFGCYTPQLEEMARWLIGCGIKTVVMEATGVYWIPVFRVLESHGLEVLLVNPRHVKYVPGRKTDVADCQWLRQLHTFGLLKGAFVPPQEVAAMRTYWRQRKDLVESASREILHMQKALTQMNIHLHVVLSDITGVSGMKILRAIADGERAPAHLAALADTRVRAPREEITQALSGHYTDEHLFVFRQALELFDVFQAKVRDCDEQLAAYLGKLGGRADAGEPPSRPHRPKRPSRRKNQPHFDMQAEIWRLTGVDFSRIDGVDSLTAFTVLSEVGFSMDAFPTEHHFASWLGLCPNNAITGGRVKRRRTKRVVNRAANALRVAAQSLWRSKSYLGAFYRRMAARMGAPKAITATAHKLARILYRAMKHGQPYVDKGEQYAEAQHRERAFKTLVRRASELGYVLLHPETGECLPLTNQPLTGSVS
jgi:transposase